MKKEPPTEPGLVIINETGVRLMISIMGVHGFQLVVNDNGYKFVKTMEWVIEDDEFFMEEEEVNRRTNVFILPDTSNVVRV